MIFSKIHSKLDEITHNIYVIFATLEDIAAKQDQRDKELEEIKKRLSDFLDQVNVVNQMEVDEKLAKTFGYEDGSIMQYLTKTAQEDDKDTYIPLSEVDPEKLMGARRG